MSKMIGADYGRGYFEDADGSNYRNYGDDPGWDPLVHTINHFMQQAGYAFPYQTEIREVACAKGYFVLAALKFGFSAEGMDISEHAINSAPEVVRPSLHLGNAGEALPWLDDEADLVCSWEFFEHVPEDEVDAVLAEKLRVLAPGGQLWMKICLPDLHNAETDRTHVTMYPRTWWETKFRAAGLVQRQDIEAHLDQVFEGRDWSGRFFIYEKP